MPHLCGGCTQLQCDQYSRSFIPYLLFTSLTNWPRVKGMSGKRTCCHQGNMHNTTAFITKLVCVCQNVPVPPSIHPDLLWSASPSSDHCGSHPALLPPGNQCLDRSHRHRCVGTGPVFCGYQVVPNAEEHLGEYKCKCSSGSANVNTQNPVQQTSGTV